MDIEEFKQKYEGLKDNPMYKNFCSILDTKNQVLERTAKKNQELKKQLEESINSYTEENALRHKMSLDLNTVKTKQKEFIEWLEHYKKALLNVGSKKTIDCVLEKHKEIVGGLDD